MHTMVQPMHAVRIHAIKSTGLRIRRLEACHRRCAMARVGFSMLSLRLICVSKTLFKKVLKRLSPLRHHGTPMMAHLQLPEINSDTFLCPGEVHPFEARIGSNPRASHSHFLLCESGAKQFAMVDRLCVLLGIARKGTNGVSTNGVTANFIF